MEESLTYYIALVLWGFLVTVVVAVVVLVQERQSLLRQLDSTRENLWDLWDWLKAYHGRH